MESRTNHSYQQLHQKSEIQQIIQDLERLREPVYGYRDKDPAHLFSFRIQQVNISEQHLALLPLGNVEKHQHFLFSNEGRPLWSQHGGMRISFITEPMGKLHDYPQRIRVPISITRHQQRNGSRIIPPYGEPLMCRFVDHNDIPISARVVNICKDGICIVENDSFNELQWHTGQRFSNCLIELDNFGEISAELRLCHIQSQSGSHGIRQIQAGACFVAPQPRLRHTIEQYRQHVELSRQRYLWRHRTLLQGIAQI